MMNTTQRIQRKVRLLFYTTNRSISAQILIMFLIFTLLMGNSSFSQDEALQYKNLEFKLFNAYYKTDTLRVLNINLFNPFSNCAQNNSLTNYSNNHYSLNDDGFNFENSLLKEIRKIAPLDINEHYNVRHIENHEDSRLDIVRTLQNSRFLNIRSLIKKEFAFNPMIFRLRNKTEAKYIYKIKVFPNLKINRVYIAVFANQNFKTKFNHKSAFIWNSGYQLGIRRMNQLSIIEKYKMNQFLPFEIYGLAGMELNTNFSFNKLINILC